MLPVGKSLSDKPGKHRVAGNSVSGTPAGYTGPHAAKPAGRVNLGLCSHLLEVALVSPKQQGHLPPWGFSWEFWIKNRCLGSSDRSGSCPKHCLPAVEPEAPWLAALGDC